MFTNQNHNTVNSSTTDLQIEVSLIVRKYEGINIAKALWKKNGWRNIVVDFKIHYKAIVFKSVMLLKDQSDKQNRIETLEKETHMI